MRLSSFGFRGKISWCAAALAASLLTGCAEDPGLQERLNRLQAEMQEKDRQLQDAQSVLERTKSELKSARATSNPSKAVSAETPAVPPSATPPTLPREQLEESYASASKAMQKRVASELRNYSVENFTLFPVVMPSDEFPYHSKVLLSIRADSGRSYKLEFPVGADKSGRWSFPTSVDVAGALADSSQKDQNSGTASNTAPAPTATPKVAQSSSNPATSFRTPAPGNQQIVPGQVATETRTIDWGGGRSTNPSANNGRPAPSPVNVQAPSQQPTPAREVEPSAPQPSRPPAQTMQSDKDVTIHW